MHPIFLIVIGAIFIFSIVILQLFIYRDNKRYLNLLLSICILGIMWYGIIFLLTNSGHIRYYPILYNKGLPLYYLMAPCLFLYFRGSLQSSRSAFRWNHLWHIIPAIPAVISIIPYNLLNRKEQQKVVEQIVNDMHLLFNPSPYIVGDWHWIVFPLIACGYCLAQYRIIREVHKEGRVSLSNVTWLYVFTAIWALIFLSMLIVSFRIHFNMDEARFIFQNGRVVFFFCFLMLILSFMFFLNPEFIYGLKRKKDESPVSLNPQEYNHQINSIFECSDGNKDYVESSIAEKLKISIIEDNSSGNSPEGSIKAKVINIDLVLRIETFIIEREIFRQAGLTLSELASLCDLPNHKLTELINSHYKLTFNNYINSLRIAYVKRRLDQGDWKQFTLEAIAYDAGFVTRNTFFIAFKKNIGSTPSCYVAGLKQA